MKVRIFLLVKKSLMSFFKFTSSTDEGTSRPRRQTLEMGILNLTSVLCLEKITPGQRIVLETKEEIEKLLKLNVVIPELKPIDRRESVRNVLKLQNGIMSPRSTLEHEKVHKLQDLMTKTKEELKEKKIECETTRRELEKLKTQYTRDQEQWTIDLKHKDEHYALEKQELEKKITTLRGHIKSRDVEIERITQRGDKSRLELEQNIEASNKKIKALEQDLLHVQALDPVVVNLTQLSEMETQKNEVEKDLKQKLTDLLVASKEIEVFDHKCQNLQHENENLNLKLAGLQSETDIAKNDLEYMKKKNDQTQQQYNYVMKIAVEEKVKVDEMKLKIEEQGRLIHTLTENAKYGLNGTTQSIGEIVEFDETFLHEEIFNELVEKISNNDKDLDPDVILNDGTMTDAEVEKICKAMMTNTHVFKLDFSDNPAIEGKTIESVCKLLLKTNSLAELLFSGCSITHDKIQLLIDAIEMNTSLVQCTTGIYEKKKDVDTVEKIMNRNFDFLSNQ